MKKFKDFLYDKNDILIALLILVAAALLIIWRMEAIMEYPKTLLSDDTVAEEPAPDEGRQSGEASGEEGGDQSESEDGGSSSETSGALWSNGALTRDVEVTIPGGSSAYDAVQILINAGLFESYEEYQGICDENGWNHQNVSAGPITFEAGFTKTDVARGINATW